MAITTGMTSITTTTRPARESTWRAGAQVAYYIAIYGLIPSYENIKRNSMMSFSSLIYSLLALDPNPRSIPLSIDTL